jgi:hypothetical protein
MYCPINKFTKALKFIEYRIRGRSPCKRLLMKIVLSDVLVDPLHQFPHTAK